MNSLKSSMLFPLLTIIFVAQLCLAVTANVYNNIVIRSSSIEWLYVTPLSSHDIKNIALDMDKYGLRYQHLYYDIQGAGYKPRYPGAIRLSVAFMGNERIYYNFVYKYQDNMISVDSNTFMDEKYIVIQWFNVETKTKNADFLRSINVSRYYNVLPYRNILLKYQDLNLTASVNYASIEFQVVNNLIFEELSVYDISIDKESIIKNIVEHNNSKLYNLNNLCLNSTYIPMYAWIDVNLVTSDKHETLTVVVNGLNSSDIDNAFKTLPCMLSILNLSLTAIQSLGVANIYEETSEILGINIVNETTKLIQTYVYDKLEYRRLTRTLCIKYDVIDPRIKIRINQSTSNVSLHVVFQGHGTINMSKEDVVNAFKELAYHIPLLSSNLSNLQETLISAHVVDTRTPLTEPSPRISPPYFIAIAVLILVSSQVAILIYTIIYIYRHWKSPSLA